MSNILFIQTQKHKQAIDISHLVNEVVENSGVQEGLCHIFAKHTTTAVTIADLDSGGTDLDYLDAFEKVVPKLNYRHPHDPSHMPDHILSASIGPGTIVPIAKGVLDLGAWQRVILFEFDGPKEREMVLTIIEQN